MKNYSELKKEIKNSNLSESNKKILIAKLSEENVDLNAFVIAFLNLLRLSATISKLFDIDIGD
jgi:hypothetical protein